MRKGCAKQVIYNEQTRDLFTVEDNYYLCQCISADLAMGAGIAVEFNKHFDTKKLLKRKYVSFESEWDLRPYGEKGMCVLEGRIFNLITKRNYYLKPNYAELIHALKEMKDIAINHSIEKIAMPLIGCGIDRLNWEKVSRLIKEIFQDTDIEILVCKIE